MNQKGCQRSLKLQEPLSTDEPLMLSVVSFPVPLPVISTLLTALELAALVLKEIKYKLVLEGVQRFGNKS